MEQNGKNTEFTPAFWAKFKMAQTPLQSNWQSWEESLAHCRRGYLLEFKRKGYSHWAIYEGLIDNVPTVIHFSTPDGDFEAEVQPSRMFSSSGRCSGLVSGANKATVRRDTLKKVAGSSKVRFNNSLDRCHPHFEEDVIINKAIEMLGVGNYSIIYNNCEHFATSCRYGKKCSTQVDNLMSVVATAMLGVIPVGLLFRAYEIGHRSYERIWLLQEEDPPRNAVTSETSLLPQI